MTTDRIRMLEGLLRRLRGWDHMATAGDGPFWCREIDAALSGAPAAGPSSEYQRGRGDGLRQAAEVADLVAAEYIGQAGEAEFDSNWIAGESVQGAAARIRTLMDRAPEGES